MSVILDWKSHFQAQIDDLGDPAGACLAALISGLHVGLRDPEHGRMLLEALEAEWAIVEGVAPEQIESRMRGWME